MQPPIRTRRSILLPLLVALAALTVLAGCGAEEKGPRLDLTAAVPSEVPDGTVLRVGDRVHRPVRGKGAVTAASPSAYVMGTGRWNSQIP